MRTIRLVSPGAFDERHDAIPDVAPDGVLLRTRAVSICSPDVSYFHGNLFPDAYPVVLGHEYVGELVAVGEVADQELLGKRLVYFGQTDFGGLAEYCALRPIFPGERKIAPIMTGRFFKDDERAAAVIVPDDILDRNAPLLEPITAVLRAILR